MVLYIPPEDTKLLTFIYTESTLHAVILEVPAISVVASILLSQQQSLFSYDVAQENNLFNHVIRQT